MLPPAERWRTRAACAGHVAAFWPEKLSAPFLADALATCDRCPVVAQCGAYADEHALVGVWGGQLRAVTGNGPVVRRRAS